jgi:hypothetical protein
MRAVTWLAELVAMTLIASTVVSIVSIVIFNALR